MSKWKHRIESALLKAKQAIDNGGVDPLSGFSLEEIESYITWNPPTGCEKHINRALHRIALWKAGF